MKINEKEMTLEDKIIEWKTQYKKIYQNYINDKMSMNILAEGQRMLSVLSNRQIISQVYILTYGRVYTADITD